MKFFCCRTGEQLEPDSLPSNTKRICYSVFHQAIDSTAEINSLETENMLSHLE